MTPLRAASLLLALVAVTAIVSGTAGFSALEADRTLEVSVTDDEHAYLGYAPLTDTVRAGERTPIVEYHNRFGADLDPLAVDVSPAAPENTTAEIVAVDAPNSLAGGATGSVSVVLTCPAETVVRLSIEAVGDGPAGASLDRVHSVTCVPDAENATRTDPAFRPVAPGPDSAGLG